MPIKPQQTALHESGVPSVTISLLSDGLENCPLRRGVYEGSIIQDDSSFSHGVVLGEAVPVIHLEEQVAIVLCWHAEREGFVEGRIVVVLDHLSFHLLAPNTDMHYGVSLAFHKVCILQV